MEKKSFKKYLWRTRKLLETTLDSRNLIKRDKYPDCPPSKIIRVVLEVDEGRTLTNGAENKKINDNAEGLTSQR